MLHEFLVTAKSLRENHEMQHPLWLPTTSVLFSRNAVIGRSMRPITADPCGQSRPIHAANYSCTRFGCVR